MKSTLSRVSLLSMVTVAAVIGACTESKQSSSGGQKRAATNNIQEQEVDADLDDTDDIDDDADTLEPCASGSNLALVEDLPNLSAAYCGPGGQFDNFDRFDQFDNFGGFDQFSGLGQQICLDRATNRQVRLDFDRINFNRFDFDRFICDGLGSLFPGSGGFFPSDSGFGNTGGFGGTFGSSGTPTDTDTSTEPCDDGSANTGGSSGLSFTDVESIAKAACENCHATYATASAFSSKKAAFLSELKSGSMPKAPTTMTAADRQRLIDYLEAL